MIVETRNSVYKITGNRNIRKIEKIGEKNKDNSVIRVGYKIFGEITIRTPGVMEILSKDCFFNSTSEIKSISGRIKGKKDKHKVIIKNNEIIFYNVKFKVEKIMINSRGSITGFLRGRLLDFGDII